MLMRVDEKLRGLNEIDLEAADAAEQYAKGLAEAMALQEVAKEELEKYIGLK